MVIAEHPDLKPIYKTQYGALFQADCLQLLPTIESNTVDTIFADPPFNLGKNYGQNVNDNLPEQDYINWCHSWIDECIRILKPGGAFFLFNLPKWNILLGTYLHNQLTFRHWIAIDLKLGLPIPGSLYPSHYSLLYYTKGRPKTFFRPRIPMILCRHCGKEIKDYGGHRNKLNPEGINLTDIWIDIPPIRHKSTKNRDGNELSPKLLTRVLSMSTNECDLVLDPFGGGGSTYAVAEKMGRHWIGCEIQDCEPIIKRLNKLLGQTDPATSTLHSMVPKLADS
jgi:site-specific DNA-methyltransferase (adenine-specific)